MNTPAAISIMSNAVTPPNDLKDQLTDMATALIRDVAASEVETRVQAFKALTSFYIAIQRHGVKEAGSEDPVVSFRAMRERIKAAGSEGP